MQVKITTDNHINGGDHLNSDVTAAIESSLSRFQDQLTRVEVHLSDINGPKGGVDKRCVIEVRPAGRQPLAAAHEAATIMESVRGAADKLERNLAKLVDRQSDYKGRASLGEPIE